MGNYDTIKAERITKFRTSITVSTLVRRNNVSLFSIISLSIATVISVLCDGCVPLINEFFHAVVIEKGTPSKYRNVAAIRYRSVRKAERSHCAATSSCSNGNIRNSGNICECICQAGSRKYCESRDVRMFTAKTQQDKSLYFARGICFFFFCLFTYTSTRWPDYVSD